MNDLKTTAPSKVKPQMITLRVTAREHYLIKQAAEITGKSINQWCKDVLLRAAEFEFLESKNEKG